MSYYWRGLERAISSFNVKNYMVIKSNVICILLTSYLVLSSLPRFERFFCLNIAKNVVLQYTKYHTKNLYKFNYIIKQHVVNANLRRSVADSSFTFSSY